MYQYSLEWFIDIFLLAIKTAEKPERNLQRRLTALQNQFIKLLYEKVCDSLFAKDKLMLSLLLTFKSMEAGWKWMEKPRTSMEIGEESMEIHGKSLEVEASRHLGRWIRSSTKWRRRCSWWVAPRGRRCGRGHRPNGSPTSAGRVSPSSRTSTKGPGSVPRHQFSDRTIYDMHTCSYT